MFQTGLILRIKPWRGFCSRAWKLAMLLGAFQRVVPLGWDGWRVRHGMPLGGGQTG